MEVFKLGKIIDNQVVDVQLGLHKVEEARKELRKSLKRRKDIAIVENDKKYKEIDTTKLFANGDTKEFDAAIVELMEKNKVEADEIRSLKMEHESQAIMLCEITEQKKRVVEDRVMMEDDKKNLANRLEKKCIELTRISNMQMDTLAQMMNLHHELNMKDIEISTLRMQNEQFQNELNREKEIAKNLNKSSEAIKYFEQLMKFPRSAHDTLRLGYNSTEVGETSKNVEQRSDKGTYSKPTFHTANVCRSRRINQLNTPKSKSYCHKCNMKGHMTQDCRSKITRTHRFDRNFHNCKKYGHKAFECISKPMWTSNQPTKTKGNESHYHWDYNTRYSYHYC